ncbi:glycine betaine/proline transport system substrate-binding protein [Arboricoccus pini]|uniref:Glycine betaine/proline transport system substrate-binding protein n=1 Tax=Arboricoccus pini TaxID=1963835 RepID=A0A212RZV6_9PROT|nr:choline ABC transporter substrate-binding protein [Arboricoccus pini]SNB78369.1 glycine betaine/proline transport system substrate-binding protein [Arboricoccus pini]
MATSILVPPCPTLRRHRFKAALSAAILATTLALTSAAKAAEPAKCQVVRLSDVGWSDITTTTALASVILDGLGYKPKVDVLAVPVTFKSMASDDIDVFLGNWMPSMENDIAPYRKDGSVETLRANLEGAKYTLAVPTYLAQQGLTDFSKIKDFKSQLGGKIYGIEPGNDGNRLVQGMIDADKFGLKGFELVESSEQGMLAQVARAVPGKQPIVFLGWEPHPMNTKFELTYLTGGDDVFGPNFGGATVYTTTRKGYVGECPNAGQFFKNLSFTLKLENEAMGLILDDGLEPEAAAKKYLKAHPELLDTWLANVSTFKGEPGLPAVKHELGL